MPYRASYPRAFPLFLLAATFALGACVDLPTISKNSCGNAIVERSSEDCDGFAAEEGTYCRSADEENGCRFDCLTDAKGKVHVCPNGWACGGDGLCRVATGSFAPLGNLIEEEALGFSLADFDGDGRDEVVAEGSSVQRVHYFDSAGVVTKTASLEAPLLAHATGLLTEGDSRADLVIAAGYGIGVMRGQTGRVLSPTQYPFFTTEAQAASEIYMFGMDGVPEEPDDELYAIIPALGGYAVARVQGDTDAQVLLSIKKGPDQLTGGRLTIGRFSPDMPCETAVLGYTDEDKLVAYTPCLPVSTQNPFSIDLPPDGRLFGRTHIVDLDGNGVSDIIAGGSVTCPNPNPGNQRCCALYLALGTLDAQGTLEFTTDPTFTTITGEAALIDTIENSEDLCTPGVDAGAPSPLPLVLTDLNNDAVFDVVTPYAAFISSEGGANTNVYVPNGSYFSDAVMEDFNGDGLIDVVAGSKDVSGLSFFLGTGGDYLNPFPVATQRPVDHFAVGDFDGDLINDLAFAELSTADPDAPLNTSGDSLSVMYGKAFAPPDAPIRMGRLDTMSGVVAARLGAFPAGPNGVDDLVVVSERGEPVTANILLFTGTGSRLLVSPHFVGRDLTGAEDYLYLPGRVAQGRFAASTHDGIGALTFRIGGASTDVTEVRFFWIDANQEADLTSSPDASYVMPLAFLADLYLRNAADIAAIDLDGDGLDEVVGLVPDFIAPDAIGSARALAFLRRGEASGQPLPDADYVSIDATKNLNLHAGVADIDRNGLQDLYVVYADPLDFSTEIVIYWNDGTGTLSAAASSTIPVPAYPLDETGTDDYVFGVAFGNFDADPELEALLSSGDFTYLSNLKAKDRSFGTPQVVDSLPAGPVIAVGAVDADGLPDVVIGDGSGLTVYRALPKRE